jgi:hypothetical protein
MPHFKAVAAGEGARLKVQDARRAIGVAQPVGPIGEEIAARDVHQTDRGRRRIADTEVVADHHDAAGKRYQAGRSVALPAPEVRPQNHGRIGNRQRRKLAAAAPLRSHPSLVGDRMRASQEGQRRIVHPDFADLTAGVGPERQRRRLRVIEAAQHNPVAIQQQAAVIQADLAVEPPGFKRQALGKPPGVPAQSERRLAAIRRGETGLIVCDAPGERNRVGAIVGEDTRVRQTGDRPADPVPRV